MSLAKARQALKDASALEVLEAVEGWAEKNQGGDNVWMLWAVLSATRGPDSSDQDLKTSLTCWVRSASLPILAYSAGATTAREPENMTRAQDVSDRKLIERQGLAESLNNQGKDSSHFLRHIESACSSLRRMRELQVVREAREAAEEEEQGRG